MQSPFPPVAEQHCGNCRYRREIGSEDVALLDLCCRYAPKPGPHNAVRIPAARWCGEWAPQEARL